MYIDNGEETFDLSLEASHSGPCWGLGQGGPGREITSRASPVLRRSDTSLPTQPFQQHPAQSSTARPMKTTTWRWWREKPPGTGPQIQLHENRVSPPSGS